MKKLLLGFSFCFASVALFAQTATKVEAAAATPAVSLSADAAMIVKEGLTSTEKEFDFGKIPQGKPVTHIFTVTNTGATAFKLDNVQASCGCTTPEWNKEEEIAPGTTSTIKVGYNAAAAGPFNKTITITYNGDQTQQIFIKGEVWSTPAASAPVNEKHLH